MRSTAPSARPPPTMCAAASRSPPRSSAQLVGAADRHARRARRLDAQHHQGHPRLAGAGGHLRGAQRRARRQRRHLHPLRQPHRGDGAGLQPRRGDAGGDRHADARRRAGSRSPAEQSAAEPARRCDDAPSASPTPRPTSAASRSCAGAMPSGPSRRCASRSACRRRRRCRSKVIDLVARRRARPAAAGRRPRRGAGRRHACALATAARAVVAFEADWRSRLLSVITEPSLALILLMVGIYGLLFEFSNPGFVLPGVVGAICLTARAVRRCRCCRSTTPGLALILLGVAFLVAEAFLPSFGVLGLGGIAAFAFGAVLLIDNDVPGFGVPLWADRAAAALVSAAVHPRGRRHGGQGAPAPGGQRRRAPGGRHGRAGRVRRRRGLGRRSRATTGGCAAGATLHAGPARARDAACRAARCRWRRAGADREEPD